MIMKKKINLISKSSMFLWYQINWFLNRTEIPQIQLLESPSKPKF